MTRLRSSKALDTLGSGNVEPLVATEFSVEPLLILLERFEENLLYLRSLDLFFLRIFFFRGRPSF